MGEIVKSAPQLEPNGAGVARLIANSAPVEVVRREIDFAYSRKLPPHLQRLVSFYEHARESDQIKTLVCELRRLASPTVSNFKVFWDLARQNPDVKWLVPTDFPDRPIKDTIECYERLDAFRWFGVSIPLGFSELACFDTTLQRPPDPNSSYEGWPPWSDCDGTDACVLNISWGAHTNDELLECFRELIRIIRPVDKPEPKRGGRRGRKSNAPATDALNQLVVYRLDKRGYSPKDACKIAPLRYTINGWKKAIKSARLRIERLEQGQFFRPS